MSDSMTLWTIAHHAPLSMGFSRKEYWGGLPGFTPGHLLYAEIKLASPAFLYHRDDGEAPNTHKHSEQTFKFY